MLVSTAHSETVWLAASTPQRPGGHLAQVQNGQRAAHHPAAPHGSPCCWVLHAHVPPAAPALLQARGAARPAGCGPAWRAQRWPPQAWPAWHNSPNDLFSVDIKKLSLFLLAVVHLIFKNFERIFPSSFCMNLHLQLTCAQHQSKD